MKNICILGAGTAGTMMANHLYKQIDRNQWNLVVIDGEKTHYYQPGFLFIPFGNATAQSVSRPIRPLLPSSIEYINEPVEQIDPASNTVKLSSSRTIPYHTLIIATGSTIEPGQIEGLSGDGWHKNAFDFYTIAGAVALAEKLKTFKGGKLVVHLAEMPVKCPVAPLEFTFLADSFFHKHKIRDQVEITYVTPLSGAFTKKRTAETLGHLLSDKKINLVTDFDIARADLDKRVLHSWDEKQVPFDLLVSIPTNMGAPVIGRSGLGDDLRFVPTDKHSLRSLNFENIFVIGDATNLPSSKAGSVAHFQAEILTENILCHLAGKPLRASFDGHANCFIESGHGKALLLDFNYETEPLQGQFPLPGIGPFPLLKESRINHWGKLAFAFIYWNLLLKGIPLPFMGSAMRMAGKH